VLQVVVSAAVRLRERVQLVQRVQREDRTVSTIVQGDNKDDDDDDNNNNNNNNKI
jgi:hypothetical protein